jgi:hypothetical protein
MEEIFAVTDSEPVSMKQILKKEERNYAPLLVVKMLGP